jgi:hypothetical protein
MYQSDRGSYRTKESLPGMFLNSCLGRIIILGVIMGLLSVIAYITCPSEQKMREQMIDNIRQCIESRDSINTDWIDDAVANAGYIFTEAGPNVNKELLDNFNHYNRMVYYNHGLYSSMHIYNNFHIEGLRGGIGIFGIVIPTLNYNDLLLRDGPVRSKDYNQPIIQYSGDDEYFGSNPDLGIFKEDNYTE